MTITDRAARAARALLRRVSSDSPSSDGRQSGSATSASSSPAAGSTGTTDAGDRIVAAGRVAPVSDLSAASEHLRSIGRAGKNWTNAVLVAEALRQGVEVTADPKRPKRIMLRHGGASFWWGNGVTSLNTLGARRIVSYKEVTSRLLLNRQLSAPVNAVFDPADAPRAWAWGEALRPLVIKPHNGNQGTDVFVGITDREEFVETFTRVGRDHGSVLVEQFHSGVEHRCLVLDHRLIAVTRRRPASVLGDGTSSITQLVEAKNADRGLMHKQLPLDEEASAYLARHGHSADSVPATDERVYLTGASNIHRGGDALDATDELTAAEVDLAQEASKQIPGLRLAALDLLLPRRDGDGAPLVLEINANPMISMHHLPWEGAPRNAAGAILAAMFPTL